MSEPWVSVAEAEHISGRKRRTLRQYAQQGRLQLRYAPDGTVEYLASDLATLATPDHAHEQTADVPEVEIIAVGDHPDGHPDEDVAIPAQMAHHVGVLRGQLTEVRADRDYWRDTAERERERRHAAELALAEALAMQVATPDHPPTTPGNPPAEGSSPAEQPKPRPWWRRLFRRG